MGRVAGRITALILVGWLLMGATHGARALYEALLVESGIEGVIQQMPEIMAESLRRGAMGETGLALSPETLGLLERAVRRAYSPGATRARLLAYLRNRLPLQRAREVLAWYRRTSAGKVTDKMARGSGSDETTADRSGFETGSLEKVSQQRLSVIRALAVESGAVERTTEITLNSQKALAAATLATLPNVKSGTLPFVLDRVERYRPRVVRLVERSIEEAMLAAYREISLRELEAHLQFYRSEPGTLFVRHSVEGLKDALADSGRRFGRALAEIIESSQGGAERRG
ncbi:MAG: hypothetical protein Kow006_06310 [Gammaproteobacteria bacterium]